MSPQAVLHTLQPGKFFIDHRLADKIVTGIFMNIVFFVKITIKPLHEAFGMDKAKKRVIILVIDPDQCIIKADMVIHSVGKCLLEFAGEPAAPGKIFQGGFFLQLKEAFQGGLFNDWLCKLDKRKR